jgi:transitional endoplasmic reticulum ATPase
MSLGLIVHVAYPGSPAGTLYRATQVEGGPGPLADATEVKIEFTTESLQTNLAQDLTFEDFGGLHEQLRLVRELVELPLRFPALFRDVGILPPKGVLLFGPPGTGKTHLSRALANEVEASFYQINGPEIVGTSYGETEGNLRRIFSEATHHAPSLILVDEVDAIAPKRAQVGTQSDTRMVTQLLASMDGLRRSDGVIVVGTTNRIDAVDPALRRPGRFDREIYFAPPDSTGRHEILQIHAREMPLSGAAVDHLAAIAERTPGYVGADLMELCREAGLSALRRSVPRTAAHHELPAQALSVHVEPRDFDDAVLRVRPSATRQAAASPLGVRWSDIGGHEAVKERLRALVELPSKYPERFASLHLEPPTGILLYGPPGTGKTLLVRALATETNANFVVVNGAEIFSQWVGESEEAIRQVFIVARQLAPAIVFVDQLDAIARSRQAREDDGTAARVVTQLLGELDSVRGLGGVIVIGATNRVDLVDPSVLRAGRLGTHVFVGLPDEGDRRAVLRVLLDGAPFRSAAERTAVIATYAKRTEGLSGAGLRQLVDEAKLIALRGGRSRPVLRRASFEEALAAVKRDETPTA